MDRLHPTFEEVKLNEICFAHISEDDIDSIVTLEGDSREVHALSPDSSIPPTLSSLTWNSDLDKNQRDIALIFLSKHRENFALDLSELEKNRCS